MARFWAGPRLSPSQPQESDDTHPVLKLKAQEAMDNWKQMIIKIVRIGIKKQEINQSVSAENVAIVMISLLEGGLMMSKLYDDLTHLDRVQEHLFNYIESIVNQTE